MVDKFLSIEEASAYLQSIGIEMKPDTLRKKIQKKEIPHYRFTEGGRPKFKQVDLENYIESKRVKADRWPSRRRAI